MGYRRGHLAHLDCYGFADVERKVPFRPDTIVRLYSMSKCLVSTAVAICVEDGLLSYDDPVGKFIPAMAEMKVKIGSAEPIPAERPVSILHLLTHTSGIGYGPMLGDADGEAEERYVPLVERATLGRERPLDPRAIMTLEQWCNCLAEIPLHSQPGTTWLYGYSHDVIGRVLEVVTGMRLDALMETRVFKPLGMVDTGFSVPRSKWERLGGLYKRDDPVEGQKAVLRRLDKAELGENEWIEGNESPILAGGGSVDALSGGIVSTVADYSRFCLMLLRKGELDGIRILKPASVEAMTTNCLPRITGTKDCWSLDTTGLGFGLLGAVTVEHPDLDETLCPGEYGWGGMAGTAWTNDPADDFSLLSFSLVAFDLTTEEELRAGVRASILAFDDAKRKQSQLVTPRKRSRSLSFWGLSTSEKTGCDTPRKRRAPSKMSSSEKLCKPLAKRIRRRISVTGPKCSLANVDGVSEQL